MLSDESSSDSETGRFKSSRSKPQDDHNSSFKPKEDKFNSRRRDKAPEHDRFRRAFDNKRDQFDRRSRERPNYSRRSPVSRRRHSRERSPFRSRERNRHDRDSRARSKQRDNSRDRWRNSTQKSHKSPEPKKDAKVEPKQQPGPAPSRDKSSEKTIRKPKSVSPEQKAKRSEVHKPQPVEIQPKKSDNPIVVEEVRDGSSDLSEEIQPGSYYSMIPAVVKEKSEESSEIDSSDDERLRAKLLNLEKELHKTRKKKHKKKHKRKSSKSKERERDMSTLVEVTSTTDIQDKSKNDDINGQFETAEVSSTQKMNQKESSEDGEISSDDSQNNLDYDPNDLRHKLKRVKPNTDVCGPALPPHLESQSKKGSSKHTEGPALPPHLKNNRHIMGPSIPEKLRTVLANSDRQVIQYESSDDDDCVGPLPVGAEDKWSDAHKQLEERALDMKIKTLDGHSVQSSEIKSREQWMLELPEAKARYVGLEARSFRAKQGPDMSDRSSWTDTPEEKALKAAGIVKEDPDEVMQRETRARQIANRDGEQEKAIRRHKKKHKRDESLLELHQKKLKKKKKKEEKEDGKKERRPFSRDTDLQVNRFDEAQKKSIIKKAQGLDSRFSSGEAKFL